MPLLSVATNITLENRESLCQKLSVEIAGMLGKPEAYVMVWIQDNQTMGFAGNNQPTAYLQLKSLGLAEDQTNHYSEHLCGLINKLTGIPANRIYIEFSSPARHLWGWDNRTFG